MKKAAVTALIFMGTLISLCIFNIILCVAAPEYRDFLASAFLEEDSIPKVDVPDMEIHVDDQSSQEKKLTLEELKKKYDISAIACSSSCDEECNDKEENLIIDKTYHEDCGTGKGYWVITYSDGSTSVE